MSEKTALAETYLREIVNVQAQSAESGREWERVNMAEEILALRKAIAAAEERGRRRGVEERSELLIEARDCLNYAHAELRKAGILGEAAQVEQMIDRIDAAFEPRDSVKEG